MSEPKRNEFHSARVVRRAILVLACCVLLCGQTVFRPPGGGGAPPGTTVTGTWGSIDGTLSDQADLQVELDAKEASDADLTALAALASTGLVTRAGAATYSARTITGDAEITVADGNGVGGNPTLAIAAALMRDAEWTAASDTAQGKVELATSAETNTGTDATRAVTPDGLDDWTGSANIATVAEAAVTAHEAAMGHEGTLTNSAGLASALSDEVGNAGGFTRGTAGAENDCVKWDASGNLVSHGEVCGSSAQHPEVAIGDLPAAAGVAGSIYVINDGDDKGDCTTGSGSDIVACISDGSNWLALAQALTAGASGALTYSCDDSECEIDIDPAVLGRLAAANTWTGFNKFDSTVAFADSANVASAGTVTLPVGNVFHITGTTNITTLNTCDATNNGREVTLIFDGILDFTDGNNLKLSGTFTTSADDTIKVVCDGSNWYQVGEESVN